mmetsp:Transcript_71692/g.181100  ORF Transcript_71692/g.181100 Transcript_71692/m.181100 type:complete len:135 (-) Transcript_71692:142-546(-)
MRGVVFATALMAGLLFLGADAQSARKCALQSACAELDGDCCPNPEGVMLNCCGGKCEATPRCVQEGLEGYCCPSSDGVMLDCCHEPASVPATHEEEEAHHDGPPLLTIVLALALALSIVACSCMGLGTEKQKSK